MATTESAVRQRLQEIREREKNATPGPWEWWSGNPWHANAPNHRQRWKGENAPEVFQTGNSGNGFFYREGVQRQAKLDTAFIASARADVPALLDLIEALLHEIEAEQRASESDLLAETHDALARFGEGR